MLLVYLQTTSQ